MEIERQFFIKEFPTNLILRDEAIYEQSYLSVNPEIRIRKKTEQILNAFFYDYKLCFKSDGNLSREEKEIRLTKEQYEALLQYVNFPPIIKKYKSFFIIDDSREYDLILETSLVDDGMLCSFMYAEVEFDSEEEANAFMPLDIFTEEITYKPEHKMKNYWVRRQQYL